MKVSTIRGVILGAVSILLVLAAGHSITVMAGAYEDGIQCEIQDSCCQNGNGQFENGKCCSSDGDCRSDTCIDNTCSNPEPKCAADFPYIC